MHRYNVRAIPAQDTPGYWIAFARDQVNPFNSMWTDPITTEAKANAAVAIMDRILNGGSKESLPTTKDGYIDESRL